MTALQYHSTELINTQSDHEHFKAKVWITLSSYSQSDKSRLQEFEAFNLALKHENESQSSSSGDSEPLCTFTLDQPGLSRVSNAAAMTASMFFALITYALAVRFSNMESNEDILQDFVSLMEIAMVALYVVIWVVAVIVVRRALPRVWFSPKIDTLEISVDDDEEDIQSDEEILQSIVEHNLGHRPNIYDELSSFANTVMQSSDRPVEIAVLACGNPDMVKTVNDFINVPASTCSFVHEKNNEAYFTFVEEDWEW